MLGAIWVIREGEKIRAMSASCPHLGCGIELNDDKKSFNCPCHASRFALSGAPETGPSPRPMDPLATRVVDGWLEVDFRRYRDGTAELQVGSFYGAAWVGMLVTSMNLFPVGQLDGGHAVFALVPRVHRIISWTTIVAVAALVIGQTIYLGTLSAYTLWLVKRVIFGDVGNEGVAALQDINGREALILGILAIAVLLLGVWPAPLLDAMDATLTNLLGQIMQSKL